MNLEPIWAGDKQAIRLHMGELSAQEMRSVLALLNLLRPEREQLQKQLRLYALELLSAHDQALEHAAEKHKEKHNMHPSFTELEEKVIQWARDRHIIPNSNPRVQLLKTMSELGELADALLKDDGDGVVDGIGDVLVTLILCANLYDPAMSLRLCLEEAYKTIKDRKGRLTPEGIFVKET
jgi:NTP pyrophosphatase (non-canonical NTP hydrolase)